MSRLSFLPIQIPKMRFKSNEKIDFVSNAMSDYYKSRMSGLSIFQGDET